MDYNQDVYIESTKGVIKEFVEGCTPEADVAIAFPDTKGSELSLENVLSGKFSLKQPLIYLEFERELNVDTRAGRWNGGARVKRKMLTFALQVITTGNNKAVLSRDRIVQKVVNEVMKKETFLSGKGLRKAECKFVGSYRVREGVHLARLEFYCEVKFIN